MGLPFIIDKKFALAKAELEFLRAGELSSSSMLLFVPGIGFCFVSFEESMIFFIKPNNPILSLSFHSV